MRIVIELKRDAEPKIVLNQLYKLTPMQGSYGLNMLAIHEGRPRDLSLREMLVDFLEHRKRVITRRSQFELRQAEARLHVLEGLMIALRNLDAVIKLIRAAKDAESARTELMARFKLTQIQAQAILDLTLRRLTSLEREKIEAEHKETSETIARLKKILADEKELMKLIAADIAELKKEFGDPRRTQIIEAEGDFSIEDLIVEEDVLVTVTHGGYIKRTPLSLYRTQRRGGRGKIGATTGEEDFVEQLVSVSTHDRLLFFTSAGKVYQLKAYELPEGGRAAKGRSIANLLSLDDKETLSALIPGAETDRGQVRLLRDPPRNREEDRARPVRQCPLDRHHRDQPRRRRRADRRPRHRRQSANRALDARRPGDPFQGRRGAPDGPRNLRRQRDGARAIHRQGRQDRHAGHRRGGLDGHRARGRDPADGLRERATASARPRPSTA